MTYSRRQVAGLLFMLGVLAAVELWQYLHQVGATQSDFFGIWSWSRFVATQGTGALYDQAAMHSFEHSLDPTGYTDQYHPFLYPPTYLLFIWPLGHLPLGVARLLWSGATLAAFLVALCGLRWRTPLVAAAIVTPATVLCLICGQNGLLTAALMIGGLRCASSRPMLAGVLLGLLTYKPHLALLVPVALIAAGLWPALVAAGVTAIIGAAISSLAFGIDTWSAWLAAQKASWATIDVFISEHLNMIPTVSAALRQLGFGAGMVVAGQIVATVAAAGAIWAVWRHGAGTRSILVTAVAALLATPYAFLYDLPMLSGAALLALAETREGSLSPFARAFFGSAIMLPQLMFQLQNATLPLAAPMLALILIWLLLLPRDGSRMSPTVPDFRTLSRWRERVG